MPKEDYIKRMLDQMAMALTTALAKLTGQLDVGLNISTVNKIKADLKNELNLDLEYFIPLSDEEFIALLKNKRFNNSIIELLSKVLFEIGKKETIPFKRKEYFRKTALLIDYLNKTDKTFSTERHQLQIIISKELEQA